jgi:hypothetical protein
MISNSVITCPKCGYQAAEEMPTDACQIIYECRAVLRRCQRRRAVYGECSMEFEYIAEIRTLGWTHIGHCVLMGQKQATHGKN